MRLIAIYFIAACLGLLNAFAVSNEQASESLLREGYSCLFGTEGKPSDLKKAYAAFSESAKLGNPDALVELGQMLLSGRGCRKDLKLAAVKFEQASTIGSADGAYFLGYMLMNGMGGATDVVKGLALYESAASKGHGQAAYKAAHAYYYISAKVPAQSAKAVFYYEQAISLGHYDAMVSFADLHVIGSVVTKDFKKARLLYERAKKLEQGNGGIASDRLDNFDALSGLLYDDRFPKPQ